MTQYSSEQFEAIQAVVDRVAANWDGATEGTVDLELRDGFAATDVSVTEDELTKLSEAIHENRGDVDAAAILG